MDGASVATGRLTLRPRTYDEMLALRDAESDPEMRQAYSEMLDIMQACPGRDEWGCDWLISLPDGTPVGGIGFKGVPDACGRVEVGYGIDAPFRKRGYATEALLGILDWCRTQDEVTTVTAQTEPDNLESQHILLRCGFAPCGQGNEGPLFCITV